MSSHPRAARRAPPEAIGKIGMVLAQGDVDAPLAEHFGKGSWLLLYESPDRYELVRNMGHTGRAVAEAMRRAGCADVVARHVGPGAFLHLRASGLRVWRGEPGVPARELAARVRQGSLPRITAVEPEHHPVEGGEHRPHPARAPGRGGRGRGDA